MSDETAKASIEKRAASTVLLNEIKSVAALIQFEQGRNLLAIITVAPEIDGHLQAGVMFAPGATPDEIKTGITLIEMYLPLWKLAASKL